MKYQMKLEERRELFLELSEFITGFERVDLIMTDLVDTYIDEVLIRVGEDNLHLLLQTWSSLENKNQEFPNLWKDSRKGLILRNIIKLWYTGTWKQLPLDWFNIYASSLDPKLNFEHVVSAKGYIEGLIWEVLGAHPPGAKPQGFGSWSEPPTTLKKVKLSKPFEL